MTALPRTGSAALAGALCALLLAACQAPPPEPRDTTAQSESPVETPPDAAPAEVAPETPAEAAPDDAPPEEAAPVTTAADQPKVQAPAAAARPPEIDDDPARLLGLDGAGVTEILGRPELMRREPPAEVWQYRGATCVFDVFLYEEAGGRRVTYLEARDNTASPIETRPCLRELLRARLDETSG